MTKGKLATSECSKFSELVWSFRHAHCMWSLNGYILFKCQAAAYTCLKKGLCGLYHATWDQCAVVPTCSFHGVIFKDQIRLTVLTTTPS